MLWLGRVHPRSPSRDAGQGARGYSLLAAEWELLTRHQEALSALESSDRLPSEERAVRQVNAELAGLFGPDLLPGHRYDVASIVVRIPAHADLPPMALRMSGLPACVPTEEIESWVHRLKGVAAAAAALSGADR